MGMEAFAELASLAAPGLRIAGIEQMEFLAPVKFYRDQPRTLTLSAIIRPDGDGLVADCTLTAHRVLPGEDAPKPTTHFTGRVRLAAGTGEPGKADTPSRHDGVSASHDDIYRVFFHGPAYQVIEEAWRDDGDRGGATGHAPACRPCPGECLHCHRAATGGGVLPDRGAVGDRPDRPDRAACPRRPHRPCCTGRNRAPSCSRSHIPPATAVSTAGSRTRAATSSSGWRDTGRCRSRTTCRRICSGPIHDAMTR